LDRGVAFRLFSSSIIVFIYSNLAAFLCIASFIMMLPCRLGRSNLRGYSELTVYEAIPKLEG
jgi:hypothetical protein